MTSVSGAATPSPGVVVLGEAPSSWRLSLASSLLLICLLLAFGVAPVSGVPVSDAMRAPYLTLPIAICIVDSVTEVNSS